MNIQKVYKLPPIHVAKDIPGIEDFVESLCGKWLNVDHYKVTTNEATCRKCLGQLGLAPANKGGNC